VFQYLLGLRRLGHALHFVEEVRAADRGGAPFASGASAVWCEAIMAGLDFAGGWTLVGPDGEVAGAPREQLAAFCRHADALVDLSGVASRLDDAMRIPIRLYVDLDPGFTQAWHCEGINVGIGGHTHYASVGASVGTEHSLVPALGLEWMPTLPPVVLDQWPALTRVEREAFTTIGNWRSYGPVQLDGVMLGQRAHTMRALLDLPRLTGESFAVALAIDEGDGADAEALRTHGWELLDPRALAGTPETYRQFISGSRAEIGVAKHGYVAARTGWFSDRSACYLAAGRPVVTHDTGLRGRLPTGCGLLVFDDVDGAADAVGRVSRDSGAHSRAARGIAEEFLDSDRVLTALMREVGAL
jgi:hypothetical protein